MVRKRSPARTLIITGVLSPAEAAAYRRSLRVSQQRRMSPVRMSQQQRMSPVRISPQRSPSPKKYANSVDRLLI